MGSGRAGGGGGGREPFWSWINARMMTSCWFRMLRPGIVGMRGVWSNRYDMCVWLHDNTPPTLPRAHRWITRAIGGGGCWGKSYKCSNELVR